MKKFLLLALAIFAAYMAGRELKRNAEVLSLLWALVGSLATATSTANTPKALSTEQRLNGVITAVGATHSVATSAQSAASTAQSTANSAQSTANSAQSTANSAFKVGDTYPGTFETGGVHASGSIEADGTFIQTGGGTSEMNGGMHLAGALQADGGGVFSSISIGTMSAVGSPATSTNAITYCNNIKQAVDGILNRL